MSLPDRRFLLLAPLAFAACGFSPVYGPDGSGTALQNRVQVAAPGNRDTYLLVQRLEERLGRGTNPAYKLDLTLRTSTAGLGIGADSTTNRFNLIGVAGYVLRDLATGREVSSGVVNSFTGYSASGTTVETLAAERDARERLMVILADQITTRLLTASTQ